MERLSKRFKEYCVEGQGFLYNPNFTVDELSHIIRILDLEEQGLLLKLPCKVGDTVYCIMTGLSYKNPCIFKMKFDYELMKHFGKRVFLTREEAEAALHMQGDRHD